MTNLRIKLTETYSLLLWLLMVVICSSFLLVKLSSGEQNYNAGLLAALEIDSAKHQAAIALSQTYQNKLLLLVGHQDLNQAVLTAEKIRTQLSRKPWLANLYSNPLNTEHLQQLINYYGASPYSYLADNQKDRLKQALKEHQSQTLSEDYLALLNQWADPIISKSLTKDATLTLATFLKERLVANNKSTGNWQFSQQEFMLKGDKFNYIPIFIAIKPSHNNIRDSVDIYQELQTIKHTYTQASTLSGTASEVLMTGMILHSASASVQAQSEISSFGVLSLLGVIFIILLAFRAITPLIACLVVIACALLVGLCALVLWFDAIHLLALVFAVSILGIAVDYGFHILVLRQHTQAPAAAIRQKVFIPLTIALVSTIAGYSLFFTTPISLLHQVVVFVGFGLFGAYLSALLLLPSIKFSRQGSSFAMLPKQHFIYLLLATLIFALGIPHLNFDDSIANLNTKSPQLLQEEQKVAALTGENIYPYMVLIQANSQEQLLEQSQQLTKQLRAQGANLKSITDWQLSNAAQQQNINLVKANWQANNYHTIAPYLELSAIDSSLATAKPLAPMPDIMRDNLGVNMTTINQQYWTALLLSAPLSAAEKSIVAEHKYADYVNLAQALSTQLSEIRHHVLQVAIPALFIILLILSLYFGLSSALVMLLVPTVSAGLALLFSQYWQSSLNIFNVLACLLIITLAIDYMVFFRAHGVSKLISHTISLSALSSALTFGVMSYSATPAVSSFGLTLLLGICLAWLLSHLTPLTHTKPTINTQ